MFIFTTGSRSHRTTVIGIVIVIVFPILIRLSIIRYTKVTTVTVAVPSDRDRVGIFLRVCGGRP